MRKPAKLTCGHRDRQHSIREYYSSYWSFSSPQDKWEQHLKCDPDADKWRKMWQVHPIALPSSTNAGGMIKKKPSLTSRSSSESSESEPQILDRSSIVRDLPVAARERPVSPRTQEPRPLSPKPTPQPPQPPLAHVEDLPMRLSPSRSPSLLPPPTDQIGSIQLPSHRTVMIDNLVILARIKIAESASESVEKIFSLTPEQERPTRPATTRPSSQSLAMRHIPL